MSSASQEPRLRAAALLARHRRREVDPQPLRLPQGLSSEEGLRQVRTFYYIYVYHTHNDR